MAIIFLEKHFAERKRIISLVIILIIVALLTWFVSKKDILKFPKPEKEISTSRVIKIDFSVLESPQLKELQSLEKVPSIEEEIGRKNPFIPY